VLAIAHRLSTVMGFDRVIVLNDGRIVEDGAPAALRHGDGPFGRLWRMQSGMGPRHSSPPYWDADAVFEGRRVAAGAGD
jgi:ATP-binding cassette subfamily B protein